METLERDKRYRQYLESKIPKTKPWPSLFRAFWVGGIICCFGELIKDLAILIEPSLTQEVASTWAIVSIVVLAAFLTGIGVYDRIGSYAGAGAIIPISGFSNSVTSPAIEFKREGIIFGLCSKMFVIAGPVIVAGVVASLFAGLIYLIF